MFHLHRTIRALTRTRSFRPSGDAITDAIGGFVQQAAQPAMNQAIAQLSHEAQTTLIPQAVNQLAQNQEIQQGIGRAAGGEAARQMQPIAIAAIVVVGLIGAGIVTALFWRASRDRTQRIRHKY